MLLASFRDTQLPSILSQRFIPTFEVLSLEEQPSGAQCQAERSVAQVKTDFLQTAKCVCAACYEHTLKVEAGCSLARLLLSPLCASTPLLVLEGILAWF